MIKGRELATLAAQAAARKKAVDIQILDLQGIFPVADYFVICSGRNTPQLAAIAREIQDSLAGDGQQAYRREGTPESGWVLLDYGDVVVHIFNEQTRQFYNLEHLWGDARVVPQNL